MKKIVVFAIIAFGVSAFGGAAVAAHAATQPAPSSDAATLSQELAAMKATLLGMQGQLQTQSAVSPASLDGSATPQDLASLHEALASLSMTLADFQVSLKANRNAVTPAEKAAVAAALAGIRTDLSGMAQVLAGTGSSPSATPVAIARSAASGNTPATKAAPSGVAAGGSDQEVQVAQVSSVAPWRAWAAKDWPIGIVIIVVLLAAIWMWRGKEAKSDSSMASVAAAPATSKPVAASTVPVSGNVPQQGGQKARM